MLRQYHVYMFDIRQGIGSYYCVLFIFPNITVYFFFISNLEQCEKNYNFENKNKKQKHDFLDTS
jgi:hypothetical protein